MFAEVFARAVEPSLHGSHTGRQNLGNLCMAPAFLNEREKRPILGTKLGQGVTQSVQFLRVDGPRRLRNIFVLFAERQKDTPQLLPAQLVNAGVTRQSEEPRLELCGRLQTIQSTDHLNKNLLGQVLNIVTAARHGVYKSGNSMLIGDNELPLSAFVAFLSPANEVHQHRR